MISAVRYHDISCGHRVVGHEGKCRYLHGHNYRIHFFCQSDYGTDSVGRVVDFGVIKSELCQWLENNWDHRMLIWKEDPILSDLLKIDQSIQVVPFNPTAENMALHLLTEVCPRLLPLGVECHQIQVDETRKCSAIVNL